MDHDFDWTILDRHVAGTASAEDQARLDTWLRADASRENLLRAYGMAWLEVTEPVGGWNTDAVWMRVTGQMAGSRRPSATSRSTFSKAPSTGQSGVPRRSFTSRTWRTLPGWMMGVLGTALVIASGGGVYAMFAHFHSSPSSATASTSVREVRTLRGQRANVQLADGSTVTLAAASVLRIPQDFGVRTRDLYLDGEAYFDVVRSPAKPFVVRTAMAETHVLGTAFGVRKYAEDTSVQVVVTEGTVALHAARGPTTGRPQSILTAGYVGRMTPAGEALITEVGDVNRYLGWMTGHIIFEAQPFAKAAPQIERWYDVEIRIADASVGSRLLVGGAFTRESTTEVMNFLAAVLDARYERSGRVVTFYATSR